MGIVQEIKHSTGETIKLVGPPVTYSYATNKIRLAPPTLGEHTKEILKDVLNYSDDKINDLRKNKIVQ